jgi:hypothetical protein
MRSVFRFKRRIPYNRAQKLVKILTKYCQPLLNGIGPKTGQAILVFHPNQGDRRIDQQFEQLGAGSVPIAATW